MPAHSRSLNGVAKLAYGGHPRLNSASPTKVVDGRNKSGHDGLCSVMPAHSRSLNGVAKLAYGGHPRLKSASSKKDVDGRNKSGHDALHDD